MVKDEQHTIKEVAETLGISTSSLRYYCKKGLVPNLRYTPTGRRIFTEAQVSWLRTLLSLRNAGMTTDDLKRYVALCRKGNETIPERKAMLETQKRQLWQALEDIHLGIDYIERKAEVFDQILTGKIDEPKEWL